MKNFAIDTLSINTLKINGVAAVNKANSGHPGIVLSAAPLVYTLFTKHLVYDPLHPKWINRDRFVLSAGHGSALLYAQLRILRLISTNDLKNFRQLNSNTPGHPEYGKTPGVESTTGPLGQGIGVAVGLALSEEHLRSKFKEIDHYTFVLCGDGDLEEGIANEALSFAGRQRLKKLIVIHDSNLIQLDTEVSSVFNEDLKQKMTALGFHYQLVKNNIVSEINTALQKAKSSSLPSFIEIRTVIGDGSSVAGTTTAHGAPLGDKINSLVKNLGWNYPDYFHIPKSVSKHYEKTIFKRGTFHYKKFCFSQSLKNYLSDKKIKIKISLQENLATRVSSGQVLSWLGETTENLIGGCADLSVSTKAKCDNLNFDVLTRNGRNILFGVREFSMASIANGVALHSNIKVFVSTFLVFSDYLKPAIRLGALMHLPVIYVFSHDSIFLGEDGPTHQPIEQIPMLRSIPHVKLIRPADEIETIAAWEYAVNNKRNPVAILLTRQKVESTKLTKKTINAYYIVKNPSPWNLVVTGSEVQIGVKLGYKFKINVISAPEIRSLSKLSFVYEKSISLEAASTFGWSKYCKYNLGINEFGHSAPGELVAKKMKFDLPSLEAEVAKIILKLTK